jgi:putative FmdB family regulatory protein
MPIYEYRCEKCGDFEVSQRITEDALKKCPTCKRKVQRLISTTSFQLKGSGWYVTDYARKGSGKGGDAASSESKSPAESSTSESSGTSEKSASTTGTKKTDTKKAETKAAAAS